MVTTSKVVGMLPKRIARLLYNVSKVRFEGGKEEAVQRTGGPNYHNYAMKVCM